MSNPAFDSLKNYTLASDISATDRMKIALVGKPKSGKSWFAATAPGTVRIYDFDGRTASLEQLPPEYKQNVAVDTFRDVSQNKPTAMKAIESELAILKYAKQQGKPIPDWFVFDSVTYMISAMQNELWSQGVASRGIKTSPTTTLKMGSTWDTVNGVTLNTQYLINEFSALGSIIFVFHEKPEKDVTESTPEKAAYTDQYTVDPQFLAKSLSLFNDVWRIQVTANGGYQVTCRSSFEFNAATTLMIDKNEQPNLTKLIEKHKQNILKSKGNKI